MVDPATVYVVADDSLSQIVLMLSPVDALVRPVKLAPVELLVSRSFTRNTLDVDDLFRIK